MTPGPLELVFLPLHVQKSLLTDTFVSRMPQQPLALLWHQPVLPAASSSQFTHRSEQHETINKGMNKLSSY